MYSDLYLNSKRDPVQEYTIHLFEHCNLNCSFCWQDHESVVGVDTILEKLTPFELMIKAEVREKITVNLMGGELFSPHIFNEKMCGDYIKFAEGLVEISSRYGKKININWVTNLVFEDTSQFDILLMELNEKNIKYTVATSYDARGRFNKKDLAIFKKNLERYGPSVVYSIGLVATKQSIEHYLKNNDSFLEWAYMAGFEIYLDYLMPDVVSNAVPSDDDLFNIFKYMLDRYPNIGPMSEWKSGKENHLSCRSSKLILGDGTICGCGNLIDTETAKKIYTPKINKTNNKEIENYFIEKYNCVTCEYFSRCQLGCFMQHAYSFREEGDECVYKRTYRYIDDLRNMDKIPIIQVD